MSSLGSPVLGTATGFSSTTTTSFIGASSPPAGAAPSSDGGGGGFTLGSGLQSTGLNVCEGAGPGAAPAGGLRAGDDPGADLVSGLTFNHPGWFNT